MSSQNDDYQTCYEYDSEGSDPDSYDPWNNYPRAGVPVPARRKKNMTSKSRNASSAKSVTHHELNGFRLVPKPLVPSHTTRPTVQRTVRLITGAVPPFLVTPSVIAAEDFAEYGATSARYSLLRVISLRAWGPDSGNGGLLPLIVSFFVQGSTLPIHQGEDNGTSGAERSNVGYVYPYASRANPYSVTDTTSVIASISNGTITPVVSFIIDVTVLFD